VVYLSLEVAAWLGPPWLVVKVGGCLLVVGSGLLVQGLPGWFS
jgi:hypothetical protein